MFLYEVTHGDRKYKLNLRGNCNIIEDFFKIKAIPLTDKELEFEKLIRLTDIEDYLDSITLDAEILQDIENFLHWANEISSG